MADVNAIGQQFTQFYYQTFDSDRNALSALYRDTSMMTWESTQIQGAAAIVEKLVNLPFQKVQHKIVTIDAQPSSPSVASLIVLVTGQLLVDDGANALQFTQVFHLMPEGGSYFVFNDVFRLRTLNVSNMPDMRKMLSVEAEGANGAREDCRYVGIKMIDPYDGYEQAR